MITFPLICKDVLLTLIAVFPLVTSVAGAGADDADAMASTVDVDALVGRDVTLCAFPAAVTLAAAAGVLTVAAAQHRTRSCTDRKVSVSKNKTACFFFY